MVFVCRGGARTTNGTHVEKVDWGEEQARQRFFPCGFTVSLLRPLVNEAVLGARPHGFDGTLEFVGIADVIKCDENHMFISETKINGLYRCVRGRNRLALRGNRMSILERRSKILHYDIVGDLSRNVRDLPAWTLALVKKKYGSLDLQLKSGSGGRHRAVAYQLVYL